MPSYTSQNPNFWSQWTQPFRCHMNMRFLLLYLILSHVPSIFIYIELRHTLTLFCFYKVRLIISFKVSAIIMEYIQKERGISLILRHLCYLLLHILEKFQVCFKDIFPTKVSKCNEKEQVRLLYLQSNWLTKCNLFLFIKKVNI